MASASFAVCSAVWRSPRSMSVPASPISASANAGCCRPNAFSRIRRALWILARVGGVTAARLQIRVERKDHRQIRGVRRVESLSYSNRRVASSCARAVAPSCTSVAERSARVRATSEMVRTQPTLADGQSTFQQGQRLGRRTLLAVDGGQFHQGHRNEWMVAPEQPLPDCRRTRLFESSLGIVAEACIHQRQIVDGSRDTVVPRAKFPFGDGKRLCQETSRCG